MKLCSMEIFTYTSTRLRMEIIYILDSFQSFFSEGYNSEVLVEIIGKMFDGKLPSKMPLSENTINQSINSKPHHVSFLQMPDEEEN